MVRDQLVHETRTGHLRLGGSDRGGRAMVEARVADLFTGCPRGFPLEKWPAGVPVSVAEWKRDGVEVEWLESYAEIVLEFYGDVMPRLASLGPADQVRLVVAANW